MPFDPKLIRPDEPPLTPAGDIELPDDLIALAEQLGDDAAHLAASYPADFARAEKVSLAVELPAQTTARPRITVVLLTAAVAAGLAISLSVPLVVSRWSANRAGQPSVATVPQPAPAAQSPREAAPPAEVKPVPSPTHSVLSLTELSGPELEALLDLQPVAASVSF